MTRRLSGVVSDRGEIPFGDVVPEVDVVQVAIPDLDLDVVDRGRPPLKQNS